jgi:chromosome segregation protein
VRLKQIKLAGFKSFVDPTSFEVPGQLVGIVGPNGCGKSNIIDAVRWVLGESKASELRGESMQDVIFSGSSERKPAARASVELVFDNSLGRLSGAWGQYAELAVKRVLGRDGQSNYSINGQSVRRRDVHDLFLGTGLGPRAYAIIGQGMISRIIEARPEDLRVFLEEAAGVSRYRERRRESENRLSDTRENLTRVEDILRELGSQSQRLEQQAEVATQFRSFEDERDRKQRLLWLLRRDEALSEQGRLSGEREKAGLAIEARLAEQRALEADIETVRAAHYEAGDTVHTAQGAFYDANAEVARIESDIRLVAQSQLQLRERLTSLEALAQRAQQQQDQASEAIVLGEEQLAQQCEQAETMAAVVAQLADLLPDSEAGVRTTRAALDQARSQVAQSRQQLEMSALQSRKATESMDALERRRERLRAELSGLSAVDPALVESLQQALRDAELRESQTGEQLAATQQRWREADAGRSPAQQALRDAEGKLARIDARIQALRQLQARLESQSKVQPWLERHGLEKLARLYPRLRVSPGWETAVEAVLRERLQAIEVGNLALIGELSADAPPAKVNFFSVSPLPSSVPLPATALSALSTMVQSADAGVQALVNQWLAGYFVADSVADAMVRREQLPQGACFVVQAGHRIGRSELLLHAADSEAEGMLARLQELDNLVREQRAQQMLADEARAAVNRMETLAASLQTELASLASQHAQMLRDLSARRVEVQRMEQDVVRVSEARDRIDTELGDVAEQLAALEDERDAAAASFEELDAALAELQELAEARQLDLEAAEASLNSAREQLRSREREAQEAGFSVRATEAELQRLRDSLAQGRLSAEQAYGERQTLLAQLETLSDAQSRELLEQALAKRTQAEQALSSARSRLDELTLALRSREESRLAVERDQEPLRQRLTDLQLREQAARINAEQLAQQLTEAGVDEAGEQALREQFSPAPRPNWLQGELTRLGNAIEALGPVNLAALDELNQTRERQGYLQSQCNDLNEAIQTLEDAIRRIDRETRELLRETYDTVNRHFGELFPRLFGGGEARLILTGEEILDAGVQVLAQPPGKRNSSIHLLSGGEKALTAIALVFAMFQLNPAPFCLLDEVDAPLDDTNTERYGDMVRAMSTQTQFLFITHNKIAMEIAEQLIGVTMQERGVSRIVAVDLESAARMAEAA